MYQVKRSKSADLSVTVVVKNESVRAADGTVSEKESVPIENLIGRDVNHASHAKAVGAIVCLVKTGDHLAEMIETGEVGVVAAEEVVQAFLAKMVANVDETPWNRVRGIQIPSVDVEKTSCGQ